MKVCFYICRRVLKGQVDFGDTVHAIAIVRKDFFFSREHLNAAALPRALCQTVTSPPARRTDGSSGWRIDSVDVFVLIAFVVDFFPRDTLPDFDTSVTPECRDPAKMKWMFKEDHSLGKKGGSGLL